MRILLNIRQYDEGNLTVRMSFEYENFYKSLIDCGYEVRLFDFSTIYKESGKKIMNDKLLEEVKAFKPDIVFSVPYEDEFDEKAFEEIKRINGKSVAWMCDDKWRWERYSKKICNYFNYVITTDPDSLKKYDNIGYKNAILSQWGLNPQTHRKNNGIKKDIKVSFVGLVNPWRKYIVFYLRKNGINVECFGKGWKRGRITQEEMIKVFNRSEICLNISNSVQFDPGYLLTYYLEWDRKKTIVRNIYTIFGPILHTLFAPKRAEDIKARFFEVTGCGSFLLSYNVKHLEKYFDIGKEIICYGNKKDLLEKIRYYLSREEEREKIAQAGYYRVQQNHIYKQRFDDIFEKIYKKPNILKN